MSTRTRRTLLLAGALGAALWLLWPRASEAPRGSAHLPRAQASQQTSKTADAERRAQAELARFLAHAASQAHTAQAEPDQHPHPLSSDHARLYRDVDLLRAAELEIRAGRHEQARALLLQHRRELPGMSMVEEEGLFLLADCAQQPSAENVARVQRFYDAHTDSTIRRTLRRVCLER